MIRQTIRRWLKKIIARKPVLLMAIACVWLLEARIISGCNSHACTVKCQENAHGRLHDFDPKNGGGGEGSGEGCLLGAGNFWCIEIAHGCILHNTLYIRAWCVVIAHGRMHTLYVQSTWTMHVPYLSRTEQKRLGGHLLHTTTNLGRTLGPKMGVGGCHAVGVYWALYGTYLFAWQTEMQITREAISKDFPLLTVLNEYRRGNGTLAILRDRCCVVS